MAKVLQFPKKSFEARLKENFDAKINKYFEDKPKKIEALLVDRFGLMMATSVNSPPPKEYRIISQSGYADKYTGMEDVPVFQEKIFTLQCVNNDVAEYREI